MFFYKMCLPYSIKLKIEKNNVNQNRNRIFEEEVVKEISIIMKKKHIIKQEINYF